MANVITTVVNLVTEGAQKSVRTLRQAVTEAEGASGKLKAGLGALGVSAGVAATAIGGALVGAGLKAVASTQQLTLEVGKFADATGLSAEQASRLVEVSSDLGIRTDTIAAAVKKMEVEIGKGTDATKEFGFELQRTSDGAADVNATFLDTVKRINAIESPTKRAEAAQAAFGRGYLEISDLIFTSADKLQEKLAAVSNQKIRTPEQIAQAREFRDNLQDLKDNAEDLSIVAGDTLIPVLSDLAGTLNDVAGAARDAKHDIEQIPGGKGLLDALGTNIFELPKKSKEQWDELGRKIGIVPDKIEEIGTKRAIFEKMIADSNAAKDAIAETGDAAGTTADEVADLGDKAANSGPKIGDMSGALDEAAQHLADLNQEAQDNALNALAEAAQAVADAVDKAFSQFEDKLDIQDLLDNITEQFGKVAEAQKKMTEDGDQGVRNYNRSVRDLRRMIRDLLEDIKGIPPDKKVQILTEIERGSIDDLYRILGDLTKGITVPVTFTKTAGFSSIGGTFGPDIAPTPIINNPTSPSTPVPVQLDQRTIINNFPVGTTPTTQYQMGVLDRQRNGDRTSL